MAARRGRGAKAQAAKAKAQEEAEAPQQVEENAADANGEAEAEEKATEEQLLADGDGDGEGDKDEDQDTTQESTEAETTDAETPAESKEAEAKEEPKEVPKVEPGKILVENLPPSYLFDYQEKLKELFSKHGEVTSVKRGPMVVTELTTAPTLSAIVEFKNKDSVEKALSETGVTVDGHRIAVCEECRPETAVLVGVPYEASSLYVKELFTQCGDITNIIEFSKNKYKILRVTFTAKEGVEKALKLDRELRINGFLVTVSQYRDNDEHKSQQNSNKNKRNSSSTPRSGGAGAGGGGGAVRNGRPSFPPRPPAQPPQQPFTARPAFRGGRGGNRGGFGRGGFSRYGPAPPPAYLPPHHNYLLPPQHQGFMNDGQRPNKRLRQM